MRNSKTYRRLATLCALAPAAIGIAAWLLVDSRPTPVPSPAQASVDRTHTVQPRPFASTVGVVGTIVPGDSTEIIAPFDGTVAQVAFEYGRAVEAGQLLVVMDTAELEQRRREAESAYLKAAEASAEMEVWSSGPEVARARRAVTAAELALQNTKRKTAETKGLLDHGLVARNEYDTLVQQAHTETMALAAAREDLAVALKKGESTNRKVTEIELKNARTRLDALTAQLDGATVKAPVSGVIVRPPIDKGESAGGALHAGQHLARGRLIGSIAKPDGLAVAIKLDESDANRVREGQPVTVTGPGFAGLTLTGRVSSVAGEATAAEAGAAGSSFKATVRLDGLSPDEARTIRIGMTANVTITTYQAPSAIVLPPQAVQGSAPTAIVIVRDPKTGREQKRPVEIGATAPDAIEIRAGLSAGDVVTWKDGAIALPTALP